MVEHLAGFKLNELRLIAYCLAHYDSSNPDDRTFYARVSDLRELFPIDKNSAYAVVERAMDGINEKPLKFKAGLKKYYWNWFSGFIYEEGTGEFEFRITPEIQPYLLGLKKTFTKYRLKAVYQFKSAYTWKLYENLKKTAFKFQWSIDLDQIRVLLGAAGKYPRWNSFQERVIAPAVAEINKKSDLEVRYDKQKRGRSIVGLVFQIKETPPENVIDIETSKQTLARFMAVEGINNKTILEYVKKAEKKDKLERCIEQFPKIISRWNKNKGSKQQYLLGALKHEIDQQTMFDDQGKKPATGQVDFSAYTDEDLEIFARVPGYEDNIQTEKKRRGII